MALNSMLAQKLQNIVAEVPFAGEEVGGALLDNIDPQDDLMMQTAI
jgi:hypothetical protein